MPCCGRQEIATELRLRPHKSPADIKAEKSVHQHPATEIEIGLAAFVSQ